jgi:hypothetical protein
LRDETGPKVTEEAGQDNWQDVDMEDDIKKVNGSLGLTSVSDAGWGMRPVPRWQRRPVRITGRTRTWRMERRSIGQWI